VSYRAEIDGLRAIAVIAVILFHAGVDAFSGGFVGVDVFFVISGYLITSLILAELRDGTFSLVSFYDRRARRILPALYFVVACCIPFALMWMLPVQLEEFSESLVAVVLLVANLLFWRKTGYFELASDEKPLLHTWTLSVEEQFYVLFPLLMIVLWRTADRRIGAVLAVMGFASLVLAEYGSHVAYNATFFLLPTRAWELLVGATAAAVLTKHDPATWKRNGVLSGLGLALVVASIALFDEHTPSPGLLTLVPTLGAVLIVACATPGTLVNRFLRLPPLVGVGLISYSAYLWHQPLLAFARLHSAQTPSDAELLIVAAATLPLAWATWRFVELPLRDRTTMRRARAVVTLASAGTVILGLGLAGHYAKGLPDRDPLMRVAAQRIEVNYGLSPACEFTDTFRETPECSKGRTPAILVWGDSFAMHLVDGVAAANPGLGIVQATRSTCGPIVGLSPVNRAYPMDWAWQCLDFNDSVLRYLDATPGIETVILSTQWLPYTNGEFGFVLADGSTSNDIDVVKRRFEATIRSIEALGKKVRIVSPPAANGADLGGCLAKAFVHRESLEECDFSVAEYHTYRSAILRFLKALERDGAEIVWLPAYTCVRDRCAASKDGTFLYQDGGHLSHEGSRWFGEHTDALAVTPH
jgi:peptidoglycan/LPS O-acetylase OafA/YrhL